MGSCFHFDAHFFPNFQFIFITTITFNTPVSYNGVTFPDWAITVGWGTCLSSMLCIPLYIGYRILYFEEGDIFQV